MRLLYAVQFEVENLNPEDITSPGAALERVASTWITEWYHRFKALEITIPMNGGSLLPADNHEIVVSHEVSSTAKVAHTVVSWAYPNENDRALYWHSRIEIGEFNGMVELSLQIFSDSIQYLIAPAEFTLRRPRLVSMLLTQFNCSCCGDLRLSHEPKEIRTGIVDEFVNSRILSRKRRLPVVLVSRTRIANRPIVDPLQLADLLAGIAEVYYLEDKWAAYALSEAVGRVYSCYNGAVRIYWPDFELAKLPYSPNFLPEQIDNLPGGLPKFLFKQFAALSALRYTIGPVTRDAQDHLEEERRNETEQLKREAQATGDYRSLFEIADKENTDLRTEKNRLQDKVRSLSAANALALEDMRALGRPSAEDGELESIAASEEPDPQSLEEAVLYSQLNLADTLVIQDTAIDSARNSPFKQYKRVQQALLAIHEVCLAWRNSKRRNISMGSLEQAFSDKGFVYKPRESVTSTGKWRQEYETTYQGKRVSIERHLALGKGGYDTCLRIHFYIDENAEKFVIAHVGRHKTNTTS